MNPSKYQNIGAQLTKLEIKPGYALHLAEENAKVDLWTDENLQKPGFATTFKLSPGTADIKVEEGKITRLALIPDLKNFNATLEIHPLNSGEFKFGITKVLDKIKSTVKIDYQSATNQGSIAFMPKFNYMGALIDGLFKFNGIKEDQPPIIVEHLKATFKNFCLCSCYNLKEKETRGAIFVNLKKAKVGTLLHFNKQLALAEADIFAKTKIRGIKLGAIASVLNANKYTFNLESKCPVHPSSFGATATIQNKQITFAAGVQSKVNFADLKVVFKGSKKQEFTTGLNAQIKFPVKQLGAATAGITMANIMEPKNIGYNFEITLNK
jgi:hypothetical protein